VIGNTHYLAVVCHSQSKSHLIGKLYQEKAVIQIWEWSLPTNADRAKAKGSSFLPTLSYCIILPEKGPIIDAKWLPLGGHDPDQKRLGLLLVACGNGSIEILPIPTNDHPLISKREKSSHLVLKVPSWKVKSDHALMRICWSADSKGPSSWVASGDALGNVVIWPLVSEQQPKASVVIHAFHNPVSGLCNSPYDINVIMVASMCGTEIKFFDIR
jgi:hypothetical protein